MALTLFQFCLPVTVQLHLAICACNSKVLAFVAEVHVHYMHTYAFDCGQPSLWDQSDAQAEMMRKEMIYFLYCLLCTIWLAVKLHVHLIQKSLHQSVFQLD